MTRAPSFSRPGLAVSDLHLFAARSKGEACFRRIEPQLKSSEVLVLNGDIFDFRWSTLGGHADTLAAAGAWLDALLARHDHLEVHYLLGNHDCLDVFQVQLEERAGAQARFSWHVDTLQLGDWLFLHGDCAHGRMNTEQFHRYRAVWRKDRPRGRFAAQAYRVADAVGLTRLTHDAYFPRRGTVGRITHYLDHAVPDWRKRVRHCCFGHSHKPFQRHEHDGVLFHNTGSAIRGMGFSPMGFDAGG